MTELCPPDPLTGGYNDITLAPLLYTYDSGDCQQKDQHIFEITHLVCVSVCGGGGRGGGGGGVHVASLVAQISGPVLLRI